MPTKPHRKAPQNTMATVTEGLPTNNNPGPVENSDINTEAKTNRCTKRPNETQDSDAEAKPVKKRKNTTKSAPPPSLPTAAAVAEQPKDNAAPRMCSPLPEHSGRNTHPGAGLGPRKRRTAEEVAAEKAAKEEKKRRLVELEEEKRKLWAQLEADEDNKELARRVNMVRRLSSVPRDVGNVESDGEFFNLDVSDTSKCESEDVEMADMLDAKGKRTASKTKRGATAAGAQNTAETGANKGGKKAGRKDKALASGLDPNWMKDAEATQSSKKSDVREPSPVGGLRDSDAWAEKPNFGSPMLAQGNPAIRFDNTHDFSRKNTDVAIIPGTEDDHKPTTVQSKPKPKSKPTTQKPKLQKEKSQHAEATKRGTQRRLNANSVRISDLPDFTEVNSKWKKVFIPSLYNELFCLKAPFKDFIRGSTEFINIVQGLVDQVYPEVEYKVSRSDPIHLVAWNRVAEKRSGIASDALDAVKEYLKNYEAADIKAWCRWAKRVDGPLFFKKPTPNTCPTDPKHKDYIIPEGRLRSPLIAGLATEHLRFLDGAIGDSARPVGLFVLIMTALERAVCTYVKYTWGPPKDFSEKFFGERITGYMVSCLKLNDNHWKEILDACAATIPDLSTDLSDDEMADLSLLDQRRDALFDFSSPIKA